MNLYMYSRLTRHLWWTMYKLGCFSPSEDSPTLCCWRRPCWYSAIPCWGRRWHQYQRWWWGMWIRLTVDYYINDIGDISEWECSTGYSFVLLIRLWVSLVLNDSGSVCVDESNCMSESSLACISWEWRPTVSFRLGDLSSLIDHS